MSDPVLEERLAAAASALRERQSVNSQLAAVTTQLQQARQRVGALGGDLAAEERDVQRLEGLSFSRVLAALRRSRMEDLDRERAERDAVAYRLREAESQVRALDRDQVELRARLAALRTAGDDWEAALAAKEEWLAGTGGPAAAEVLSIAETRGRLRAEQREVAEALAAAGDAARALGEVADRLESASGWSTYDTFFGGGALSSAVKHDRIDSARRAAAEAESRLAVLASELRDVDGEAGAVTRSLELDGMTRFIDVWFDNIFTDWAVADQISRAKESVTTERRAVAAVEARLVARNDDIAAQLASLAQRRVDLLSHRT